MIYGCSEMLDNIVVTNVNKYNVDITGSRQSVQVECCFREIDVNQMPKFSAKCFGFRETKPL